jgi:hypothetical protein
MLQLFEAFLLERGVYTLSITCSLSTVSDMDAAFASTFAATLAQLITGKLYTLIVCTSKYIIYMYIYIYIHTCTCY